MNHIEVDVWVRGTHSAVTHTITSIPVQASDWRDGDVRTLLSEMLLALDREKNPGGEAPQVTLRGFSWIVSPDQSSGVVLHLETHMGTASAGPFAIDEQRLTTMVTRVMTTVDRVERVH